MILNGYDTAKLEEIARQYRGLREALQGVDMRMQEEMILAKQAELPSGIVEAWTGLSRDGVRLKSMTLEERRHERANRTPRKR